MRCLVGIDDTDSSRGMCTTYLAYRVAVDLAPDVRLSGYPRLVRLNPNVPFKTRGNAAVCLPIDASDTDLAFRMVCEHVSRYSDVEGGANSGVAFLEKPERSRLLHPLYRQAVSGMVNPSRARRLLAEAGARTMELGNGMGLVGAAGALGFGDGEDRTYELISYRSKDRWGTPRSVDSSSVRAMDAETFPHTYNNYDYQKRKVLVSPHGPDPVLAGIRGDSPAVVIAAYRTLKFGEEPMGHMVYATNQHTDAHLRHQVEWKAFSSGWVDCAVEGVEVGPGGHVYLEVESEGSRRTLAAYEPTGDLRRAARLLGRGDRIRAFGGVRKATSLHPGVLNLEKFQVVSSGRVPRGVYISSPRSNRHLTKPLVRYGRAHQREVGLVSGWLSPAPRQQQVLARSR